MDEVPVSSDISYNLSLNQNISMQYQIQERTNDERKNLSIKLKKDKFALRAKITARISHLEVEGKGEG